MANRATVIVMRSGPNAAPSLAVGSDRFSIIERKDGSRQWAFDEQPLFRYKGDLQPGDAHGRDTMMSSSLRY